MSQVIQICVGSAGLHLGTSFFSLIAEEHGLDLQGNYLGESFLQREMLENFFLPEISQSKYSARALLVDLDCSVLDSLRVSPSSKLFRAGNLINLQNGADNNWGKGFYIDSWAIMKKLSEQIRKEAELCDNLQGFQLVSSISGGTGGGLGCKLLQHLAEEYPKIFSTTTTVFSHTEGLCNNLSPYNHVLSLPSLFELPELCVMLDNFAISEIFSAKLQVEAASFPDFNHLIAGVLGLITGPMRFQGPLPTSFSSLVMNMAPLQKFHLLSPSLAPLAAKLTPQFKALSAEEVFLQMSDPTNFLTKTPFKNEKTLAKGNFFRGHLGDQELETLAAGLFRNSQEFLGKVAEKSAFLAHSAVPPKGMKLAGGSLVNTAGFRHDLREIKKKFDKLFLKKTFLHWFLGNGMEEAEFQEKSGKIEEIIKEYEEL